jgi:hypothetical protein
LFGPKVPGPVIGVGAAILREHHGVPVARAGVQPDARRKNIVIESRHVLSTSLAQSQSMQFDLERAVSVLEVAFVFSRRHPISLRTDAAECRGRIRHFEAAGAMA